MLAGIATAQSFAGDRQWLLKLLKCLWVVWSLRWRAGFAIATAKFDWMNGKSLGSPGNIMLES